MSTTNYLFHKHTWSERGLTSCGPEVDLVLDLIPERFNPGLFLFLCLFREMETWDPQKNLQDLTESRVCLLRLVPQLILTSLFQSSHQTLESDESFFFFSSVLTSVFLSSRLKHFFLSLSSCCSSDTDSAPNTEASDSASLYVISPQPQLAAHLLWKSGTDTWKWNIILEI